MTYFDEERQLNLPRGSEFETSSRTGSARQQPDSSTYDHANAKEQAPVFARGPLQSTSAWTGGALDATNNKLQELMQLFYLLSRDPAIPQDARYHITMAQSEIALLTRLMQNIAGPHPGERQPSSQPDTFTAGNL